MHRLLRLLAGSLTLAWMAAAGAAILPLPARTTPALSGLEPVAPRLHQAPAGLRAGNTQVGPKVPRLFGQVNINTATVEELVRLPGIGPARARAILVTRQARPFRRAADLVRVKGIGRRTVKRLLPYLTVDGPTDLRTQ